MKTSSSFQHPALPAVMPPLALVFLLVLRVAVLSAQQPAAAITESGTDTYRSSRTPVIKLTLSAPAKGSLAAKLAKLNALAGGDTPTMSSLLQPQPHGGVFDEVNLGYLDGSGKAPAPATVNLQFDASRAGASVWVQPLDGGAILSQDADGNPVSSPGGCAVVLDASGQLVFGYQALTLSGRYQVLIRLDNVSSVLPFVIPDPNQDN